jgi:lysophospholipid acyltransferase (LPLAT)-like uncharacterized protein
MTDTPEPIVGPRRRRHRPRRIDTRRLTGSNLFIRGTGFLAATYLRLVRMTGSIVYEPGELLAAYGPHLPIIGTMWHGHHFGMPLIRPPSVPIRVLISRHRDGGVNAAVAESFGMETIRGSGGRDPRQAIEKGAIAGLLKMKSSLEDGWSVVLTADISKGTRRRAGRGIVTLARISGRPIVGFGMATSRRIVFDSWDRMEVGMPFSRMACVGTAPITVPAGADDAQLEDKRLELEQALNAATDRANEIVGRGGR